MARQATKACGNRYYEARMRAAMYNEKFLTRAGAVESLPGVTEDSLKKYELDINRPPNIVVALMADAYNEPELRAWYCSNECPLGRDCREIPEMPAERALIRLQNSVYEMQEVTRQVGKLMEDGKLSEEEKQAVPGIREQLLEFRRRADETLMLVFCLPGATWRAGRRHSLASLSRLFTRTRCRRQTLTSCASDIFTDRSSSTAARTHSTAERFQPSTSTTRDRREATGCTM